MSEINNVIQAYQNNGQNKSTGGMEPRESDGPSFGDMVKNSLEGAIDSQKASEKVAADAMAGNASMIEVVDALNQAEMSLNMVVAVRDRVISAYQEIVRMPI